MPILSKKMQTHIRKLKQKKYRSLHQQFLIEGEKFVATAVNDHLPIRLLVISQTASHLLHHYQKASFPIYQIPDSLLLQFSDTKTPQGIIAVSDFPLILQPPSPSHILALFEVQDCGNLGTLFRTAAAMNFDQVLLSENSASPYNPKTVRASAGNIWKMPFLENVDFSLLQDRYPHHQIIGADAHGTRCDQLPQACKRILLLGNEGRGLPSVIQQQCSHIAAIPMNSSVESLNLAAAGSILLYLFRPDHKESI